MNNIKTLVERTIVFVNLNIKYNLICFFAPLKMKTVTLTYSV